MIGLKALYQTQLSTLFAHNSKGLYAFAKLKRRSKKAKKDDENNPIYNVF